MDVVQKPMTLKLIEYTEDIIGRGMVLRCKTTDDYPYGKIVDFLVCETIGGNTYHLMVISGYKAGLQLCRFPEESLPEGNNRFGLKTKWLIENRNTWGYGDACSGGCSIDQVYIFHSPEPDHL